MNEKLASNDNGDIDYGQWRTFTNPDAHEYESLPEEMPSPEEKKAELTFEKMAELSTEEYLELWKHLNPFYVTHVTRQGVRDHNSMIYHSGGMGAIHDGFKKLLEDGKFLRSPAEVGYGIPPSFTEEDVAAALDQMIDEPDYYEGMTPDQIVEVLPINTSIAAADPWADRHAIHFAQHTVLDDYYGGETGNEVFYVFPTDVIASQCKFGGHMHDGLTTAQVQLERKWNDMFVWPEDGKIPLDAGLVFLPKSQMVDRRTGSRYDTQETVSETGEIVFMPRKDEERIGRFKEWLEGLSEDSPEVVAAQNDGDYSLLEAKMEEIGIPEQCVDGMIRYGNIYTLLRYIKQRELGNVYLSKEDRDRMTPEEISDYSIRQYLSDRSADMKFADDPITAQEYWEQYFASHPDKKPMHVIYYDGDPSVAVRDFLADHGILEEKKGSYGYRSYDTDSRQQITGPGDSSERDGKMLGFEDHYIGSGTEDEQLISEHQRFNQLASKILTERQAK